MDVKKTEILETGRYICVENEWLNIAFSHLHELPCWHIYTRNSKFLDFGFCRDGEYFCLNLEYGHNYDYSAFNKDVFCNYQGGKYQPNEKTIENMVVLFPDLETRKELGFYINSEETVDVLYDKFIEEVTDIWEERIPVEGFKFDVKPIVYLKKDGVWLVDH